MKNLTRRALAGFAAILPTAIVATMSPPAWAAGDSYAPHGGPDVFFIGSEVAFTVVDGENAFACEQFDLRGTITDPSVNRVFGATAGSLDQNTSSGCVHWWFGPIDVTPTGTWRITMTGPEVGTVSPAALTDAWVHIEGNSCSFYITGEVSGEFDDATGVFTPFGSPLTIADDPVGYFCPLFAFEKGQTVAVSGSWTITGLTITNS